MAPRNRGRPVCTAFLSFVMGILFCSTIITPALSGRRRDAVDSGPQHCSEGCALTPLDVVIQRDDGVLFQWVKRVVAKELPSVRPLSRWWHYLPVYHRHLGRWFNASEPVHVLEIGLGGGGSIDMWKAAFGPNLRYYGIDDQDVVLKHRDPASHVEIFIGDQADPEFWARVLASIPPLDVLIDDGGHTVDQQVVTLKATYEHLKPVSVYLIEDTHTSYFAAPGFRAAADDSTLMDFLAVLVSDWHKGWRHRGFGTQPDAAELAKREALPGFRDSTVGLHLYDSMVVLERAPHPEPLGILYP